MPKDPTVQVAAIGIITTLITTFGVLLVAILNNKRERSSAAGAGVETTLRERIVLRDEQIADLREEKGQLQDRLDLANKRLASKTVEVELARAENARLKEQQQS